MDSLLLGQENGLLAKDPGRYFDKFVLNRTPTLREHLTSVWDDCVELFRPTRIENIGPGMSLGASRRAARAIRCALGAA